MPARLPRCCEILGTTTSVTRFVNEAPDEAALITYGFIAPEIARQGCSPRAAAQGDDRAQDHDGQGTRLRVRHSHRRSQLRPCPAGGQGRGLHGAEPRPRHLRQARPARPPALPLRRRQRHRRRVQGLGQVRQGHRTPRREEQGRQLGDQVAADTARFRARSRQADRVPRHPRQNPREVVRPGYPAARTRFRQREGVPPDHVEVGGRTDPGAQSRGAHSGRRRPSTAGRPRFRRQRPSTPSMPRSSGSTRRASRRSGVRPVARQFFLE